MQQIKNFLSKREQSQARLRFAECEKSRLKAKIIMTLALLLTAATGAWAESKPIGLNVEYAAGDEITSTTDVYVYYGEQPGTLKKMGVKITSTQPLKIFEITAHSIELNGDAAVYYLPDGEATGGSAGFIPCVGESTGDATVVHVASGSGTLADPYVFAPGPFGTPVDLTRGTGEKINEWTLTNGMPAGNVLLTVAYKDRATMALTYGGTAITTEANAVTAFMGCEQEFAEALTPAVQNIEPTFNSGTAQDVTTTLAADFTFKSSDAAIIGFKSGETYADEGTLDQMEFRALTTSPVTLTVTYKGTDDLESKSQTLLVTIEKKTYTVSLADNTKDADSWKGNVNDAETDVNLPITKLEGGEKVTLKYNGRLKVKSVTATTDAAPAATLQSITVGKGSTELSSDKIIYYMPGDTYRQALAREENQTAGNLGWSYWEDTGLTTVYFKEVSTKAWDMAIDGDSNFASGQGSSTITLDTVIDTTGHTFQFVNAQ